MTSRREPFPAPTDSGPASPVRTRRLSRLFSRLAVLLFLLLSLLLVAAGGLLLAVPSVGSASSLVAAYLAAHGTRPIRPPPPPRIADAAIATEDHMFDYPPGVDIVYGALRYSYNHLLLGRPNEGGSTIAQQLAKLLYTKARTGPVSELEQIGLALKLELTYSHAELLTLYLDAGYYGQDAHGIARAAETYFGRSPAQCT